jgi:MarR family transcriptional regulator, organic hydroperoxide resistance regulator
MTTFCDNADTMPSRLAQEIKQKRPFETVQEEVFLSLQRTADQIAVPLHEVLRSAGLSQSKYNILRILRGAGEEGLPCGEIAERMVRRDPDLTRLLDRLEASGLVSRSRDTRDRRVVRAEITRKGLDQLDQLDGQVNDSLKGALRHISVKRQRELLAILDDIRAGDE